MGKNKLKKFADMEQMSCVFQYPFGVLRESGFPLRVRWNEEYFRNSGPIVLELGCGKGEYTVGLARRYPEKNFIGIDIKGARMWTGARAATEEELANAAFLRTNIELLPHFFAPGEVSEIWITFPDPQMKKVRKRLTSTTFLNIYRRHDKAENRLAVSLHLYAPDGGAQRHRARNDNRRPIPQRSGRRYSPDPYFL